MAIEVNTTEYQFSHGHTPRGRGSWAFCFTRNAADESIYWAPGSLTYTEALKLAKAEAKARGRSTIYVAP
jgi:hypothetical protein